MLRAKEHDAMVQQAAPPLPPGLAMPTLHAASPCSLCRNLNVELALLAGPVHCTGQGRYTIGAEPVGQGQYTAKAGPVGQGQYTAKAGPIHCVPTHLVSIANTPSSLGTPIAALGFSMVKSCIHVGPALQQKQITALIPWYPLLMGHPHPNRWRAAPSHGDSINTAYTWGVCWAAGGHGGGAWGIMGT